MRVRRLQFSIGSLLALTAACGIGSQWLRGPVIRAAIEPLGVVTDDDGSLIAQFRITNAGPDSLWYTGYGHESPWYSAQVEIAGKWTAPASPYWCGTGAALEELTAGEVLRFDVPWRRGGAALKAGLNLGLREPDRTNEDSENTTWVEIWSKSLPIPPGLGASVQAAAPSSNP